MNRETRRKQREELTIEDVVEGDSDMREYEIEKFRELVELAKPSGLIHRVSVVEGGEVFFRIDNTRHVYDLKIPEGKHLLERLGRSHGNFYRTGSLDSLKEDYDSLEFSDDYYQSESVGTDEDINVKQLISSKIV